jgi:hypothetical protein
MGFLDSRLGRRLRWQWWLCHARDDPKSKLLGGIRTLAYGIDRWERYGHFVSGGNQLYRRE